MKRKAVRAIVYLLSQLIKDEQVKVSGKELIFFDDKGHRVLVLDAFTGKSYKS